MDNENTMKGDFITSIWKYVFGLFFILSGSFIAIRFGIWGVDAVRTGAVAAAVFSFTFAVIGLLLGVSAVFLFNHNKSAYLTVDNQKIDAQFGFGNELHEPISKIRKVTLMRRGAGGAGIELHLSDRICWITGLNNAKEICSFILSVNSGARSVMSVDEAKSNLLKHKKIFVKYLVLTVFLVAMLFVHIAWCVLLTDGKDFGAFSQKDNIVFVGFAVAELITLVITFVFADKCGKQNKICKLSRETLLSAAAAEHKNDSLDRYPNVIGKKYFDDNTYRIVIFAPESDVFAYMLERFDLAVNKWVNCYDNPRGYKSLSELYDSIEESFEDVILED